MDKFKDLDDKALAALLVEKQTAATALVEAAGTEATDEQAEQAIALTAEIDEITAEQGERTTAATRRTDAFAGLRDKVAASVTEDEPEEDGDDADTDEPDEADEAEDAADGDADGAEGAVEAAAKEGEPVAAGTKPSARVALAKKTARPAPPEAAEKSKGYKISAAPETGFNAGSELDGIEDIAKAAINRLSGMSPPTGDGESENLSYYSIGTIKVDYDDDNLVTKRTSDDAIFGMMERARNETLLEGGSLVAAGGWCAPSETLYDLAADESLDGLVSLPEIGINRGGIRWTVGPQFADFYANAGFAQTEAQAIAGTTKPCYEVTCPSFTEMRLEAVGLCIKVPILTEAGYPELVNRFTSGTLVAHEHWLNNRVIGKMVTLAGTVRTFTGIGSTVQDAMSALELVANQRRQIYRLALSRTMECVVPYWVRAVMRDDLAARNGVGADAITDAQIDAHFSVRNINVQYVYDWQDLTTTDEIYPSSFNALVYPAGTYVKGVSDIIKLSAVYDAASLAVNTYTGLFVERGLLVANMQYTPDYINIPIESVGRTGRQDLGAAT